MEGNERGSEREGKVRGREGDERGRKEREGEGSGGEDERDGRKERKMKRRHCTRWKLRSFICYIELSFHS